MPQKVIMEELISDLNFSSTHNQWSDQHPKVCNSYFLEFWCSHEAKHYSTAKANEVYKASEFNQLPEKIKVTFSSIQINTLKCEDRLRSPLGYTTLFTSQNSAVVNLAAMNGLAGAQHFLLALRRGRAPQRPSAPDTGQKQEAREASENNTVTQTLKTLTSPLSELGQRLNWVLWAHLFCLDFMLTFCFL